MMNGSKTIQHNATEGEESTSTTIDQIPTTATEGKESAIITTEIEQKQKYQNVAAAQLQKVILP